MKSLLISVFLSLSLSCSCQAVPSLWAKMTRHDLLQIQKALQQNAPLGFAKTKRVNRWYQMGFNQAMAKAVSVTNFAQYYAVLNQYVTGLSAPGVRLTPLLSSPISDIEWPGFTVGDHKGVIQVVSSPCHSYAPNRCPRSGAKLVSCDGKSVNWWITQTLLPDMTMNPHVISYQSLFTPNLLLSHPDSGRLRPKQCTFDKQKVNLKWHLFRRGLTQYLAYISMARDLATRSLTLTNEVYHDQLPMDFAIHHFAKNAVWIRLPSFSFKYKHHLQVIADNLKSYQKDNIIVFDLRGNYSQGETYAHKIIASFYGWQYLKSLGASLPLNLTAQTVWRVSKANRHWLAQQIKTQKDAELVNAYRQVLKAFGKVTAGTLGEITVTDEKAQPQALAYPNPVKSHIYLLTDQACAQSCWRFVRNMRALPGVVQIGMPTGLSSVPEATRTLLLSSQAAVVSYPVAKAITPSAHLGKPFLPVFRYRGFMGNTTNLERWVLHLNRFFKSGDGSKLRS